MKDEVLKRKMFSTPMGKDVNNVGIMAGFMDDDESKDDDYEDMNEEAASSELSRRSPQSPEILMNNLRGDIRSVDARYEELAQMVGEQAAMETPPEVLAMLQGQMAQQQGIGALPQAPAMPPELMGQPAMPPEMMGQPPMPAMPPEMMGQPPMPQAPMPMDQGPMAMARGGIVQRFSDGSDEEGVTPATSESSSFPMLPGMFSPEVVSQARTQLLNMASQKPMTVPTLKERLKERLPEYQELLAPDTSRTQAGLLLDLASAAFGFGANVDPATGQPMRGSFASRLMQAGRTLPGRAAERLEELTKADRAIKLAAIQAGEKDIDTIRSLNLKLNESKRQALSDIIKSGANPFKAFSGMKDIDVITFMAPMYKDGSLDENGRRLFEARVTNYTQPQVMQITDPVTGNISTREIRKQLPVFAVEALRVGQGRIPIVDTKSPSASGEGPRPTAGVEGPRPTSSVEEKPTGQSRITVGKTLWEMAPDITGPVPSLGTSSVLGPLFSSTDVGKRQQQSRQYVENKISELVRNLQTSPLYAEGERKSIKDEVGLGTKFWDSTANYRNRMIGIDTYLNDKQAQALNKGFSKTDTSVSVEDRRRYRKVFYEISAFRDTFMPADIRAPIPVNSLEEAQLLSSGTRFIWTDGTIRVKK